MRDQCAVSYARIGLQPLHDTLLPGCRFTSNFHGRFPALCARPLFNLLLRLFVACSLQTEDARQCTEQSGFIDTAGTLETFEPPDGLPAPDRDGVKPCVSRQSDGDVYERGRFVGDISADIIGIAPRSELTERQDCADGLLQRYSFHARNQRV